MQISAANLLAAQSNVAQGNAVKPAATAAKNADGFMPLEFKSAPSGVSANAPAAKAATGAGLGGLLDISI